MKELEESRMILGLSRTEVSLIEKGTTIGGSGVGRNIKNSVWNILSSIKIY